MRSCAYQAKFWSLLIILRHINVTMILELKVGFRVTMKLSLSISALFPLSSITPYDSHTWYRKRLVTLFTPSKSQASGGIRTTAH